MTNPFSQDNPLGLDGIEYVEYVTATPRQFGAALEQLGFTAVARHRSREVIHYKQGGMNIIVNADPGAVGPGADDETASPRLKAFALRVQDAAAAYKHCIDKGAWPLPQAPSRIGAMELNIPGVCGVGDSVIYFVDRYKEFSIYDVDFKRLPNAQPMEAIAGMHYFGVVQAIDEARTREWVDFYGELFGFKVLPQGQYFGVLPKGTLLESPCKKFYLQLVEPPEPSAMLAWQEKLTRVGFGSADIQTLVKDLSARGIKFVESDAVHTSERGAVTYLGGTSFEFVKSHLVSHQ